MELFTVSKPKIAQIGPEFAMSKLTQFLFGRPLDKIDRHVAKHSLQLFFAAEFGIIVSKFFFPLSPDFQMLYFIGVGFYLGREIHSHAYYHYLRNSLGRE